ncbi:MAG: hypothetical protein JSS83_11735 [Cyanobacteria bacterium SZAS LIN-3]|nr:hypothetical protein [Cyanobacteria bacterium SZAS LIN-3]
MMSSVLVSAAHYLTTLYKRPILKLPLAIAFLAILVLWPVVGVSRPMPADFITQPQFVVYALVFFTACLGYWESVAALFAFNRDNLSFRLRVFSWCAYLSLFLTSCLLCRRLKVCLFHIHNFSGEIGSWIGPPIVLVGTLLVLASLSETRAKKPTLLAYPQFLGLLFMLAGVSIAHWAWFPLLALPGVLVVEAWYIAQKEHGDSSELPADRQPARFKILPFIY